MNTSISLDRRFLTTEPFCSLSAGAQTLYLQLAALADRYGIVTDVSRAQSRCHADSEKLRELLLSGLAYCFEDSSLVLLHWWVHNDRSQYGRNVPEHLEYMDRLHCSPEGVYDVKDEKGKPVAIPPADVARDLSFETNHPTPVILRAYAQANGLIKADLQKFFEFYDRYNWSYRGQPVDWKTKLREWDDRTFVKRPEPESEQNFISTESLRARARAAGLL